MGRLHKPEIQIPHLRWRPGQAGFPVDEKLQGTLEARLGESFKQVSDRLEQVYKGLGEMQTLAAGVGDLKRLPVAPAILGIHQQ